MKKTLLTLALGALLAVGTIIGGAALAGVTLQSTVTDSRDHVELGWRRMVWTIQDVSGCDGELDSGNCFFSVQSQMSGEDGTGAKLAGVDYHLGFKLPEGSGAPEISFTTPRGSSITPSCPSPTRTAVLATLATCQTQCFDAIDNFAQKCARTDQ